MRQERFRSRTFCKPYFQQNRFTRTLRSGLNFFHYLFTSTNWEKSIRARWMISVPLTSSVRQKRLNPNPAFEGEYRVTNESYSISNQSTVQLCYSKIGTNLFSILIALSHRNAFRMVTIRSSLQVSYSVAPGAVLQANYQEAVTKQDFPIRACQIGSSNFQR